MLIAEVACCHPMKHLCAVRTMRCHIPLWVGKGSAEEACPGAGNWGMQLLAQSFHKARGLCNGRTELMALQRWGQGGLNAQGAGGVG